MCFNQKTKPVNRLVELFQKFGVFYVLNFLNFMIYLEVCANLNCCTIVCRANLINII